MKLTKKIKQVHFIAEAMINFELIKHIESDNFELNLLEDFIMIQDKKSKITYMVPVSNIRTLVLQ